MISTSTGEREEDAKEKIILKTDFKILTDGLIMAPGKNTIMIIMMMKRRNNYLKKQMPVNVEIDSPTPIR